MVSCGMADAGLEVTGLWAARESICWRRTAEHPVPVLKAAAVGQWIAEGCTVLPAQDLSVGTPGCPREVAELLLVSAPHPTSVCQCCSSTDHPGTCWAQRSF